MPEGHAAQVKAECCLTLCLTSQVLHSVLRLHIRSLFLLLEQQQLAICAAQLTIWAQALALVRAAGHCAVRVTLIAKHPHPQPLLCWQQLVQPLYQQLDEEFDESRSHVLAARPEVGTHGGCDCHCQGEVAAIILLTQGLQICPEASQRFAVDGQLGSWPLVQNAFKLC